jgi:hypothetical protein
MLMKHPHILQLIARHKFRDIKPLKGQCHEISDFRFFYELVSPKPLSVTFGPFQIFQKIEIFAEIFAAQGAPPVSPVANEKKIFNRWCTFTCEYLSEFSKTN